jgi:hypothetical protein
MRPHLAILAARQSGQAKADLMNFEQPALAASLDVPAQACAESLEIGLRL